MTPGEADFVLANVAIFGFQADATPRLRVLDSPAGKIGVTAVLGDSLRPGVAIKSWKFSRRPRPWPASGPN